VKIIKLNGNDCGGFKPPKGHMDSQMFPECEGKETDRDIVKKTVERRKKHKKTASIIEAKHTYPMVSEKGRPKGIWEQWKEGIIDNRKFVEMVKQMSHMGFQGISKDPTVRRGIMSALMNFNKTRDYSETARAIGSFLSMGESVEESHFAESNSWYKKAKLDFPELRGNKPASEKAWLNPPFKEKIINYFKENHPDITATFEEMYDFYRRNFTNIKKEYSWEEHQKRNRERNRERMISDLRNRKK